VITYPVSIGKMDWRHATGETRIIAKQKNPSWYPPESVRKEHEANGDPLPKVVPAGPDNPLGDFAMRLAVGGGSSYMLHGTNKSDGGRNGHHPRLHPYVPGGCGRPVPLVAGGHEGVVDHDPVKVAYADGELLLEAHPPVDSEGQSTEPNLELLSQLLDKALGPRIRRPYIGPGAPDVAGRRTEFPPGGPAGPARSTTTAPRCNAAAISRLGAGPERASARRI